ncbi:MAG: hypothetical protein EOP42_01430 [Sphingobacteriaceae bacterium]|nr:MAG: hypothetical protein EOP42_01430 [Sphingobacteriaceae bacterium]
MAWFCLKLKKILLTGFLVIAAGYYCNAQKQLLTYSDLQYLTQNNVAAVTGFLQQKDYHLQNAANGELRFFGLIADEDYNDVYVNINGKHTSVTLTTTDLLQVETIQKSLQNLSYKNSKKGKSYRVKDAGIAVMNVREPVNPEKAYIIQFEN